DAGHRVIGIDVAPSMLEEARRKAAALGLAVDFRDGDAEAPNFPDRSFDLIVERHVLWTLPNPESAVQAWRRLLRIGGRLILIEGHWHGMEPREEYAKMHDQLPLFGGRPEDDLAALIRSCGFASVATEPVMDPALWVEAPSHPRYLVTAQA
ncbi:MAG TPA: class I SAM-dependent methyltransferase, partial [Candidatus Binataceae bacterium]|nr:class I SAM-dependent methyltransferase [Candidatus Binataceae bacterium]